MSNSHEAAQVNPALLEIVAVLSDYGRRLAELRATASLTADEARNGEPAREDGR